MDNSINEAVKRVAKDSMLQKIDTIAITYKTTDGQVHSFSMLDAGESRYALIGMIDDLKREAYSHFEIEDDE